ncbi:MAG: cupredoxin domain-containing protein [Anaerolineae bacterium]|nr:cupredoxin domain-containing protein [Anaerolineae bacterium]
MTPRYWITGNLIVIAMIILTGFALDYNFNREPSKIEVEKAPTQAGAVVDVEYTLKTMTGGSPMMAFVGIGGEIDGLINPALQASVGKVVKINLLNADPVEHDLVIDGYNVTTGKLYHFGEQKSVVFQVSESGEFVYFCSVPGHREMGMEGRLVVE